MKKATPFAEIEPVESAQDVLTEIVRDGARRMLAAALEHEVADYLAQHAGARDESGRQLVVRNGHHREREIQTGVGSVPVRQPRVNDRRVDEQGNRIKFTSKILPPYLRRTKAIEELIPWLYLKGVSTGGFSEALGALLGTDAPGLSSSTVVRLKQVWETDFKEWNTPRPLGQALRLHLGGRHPLQHPARGTSPVHPRRDGRDGRWRRRSYVAVQDGYRESEQSWRGATSWTLKSRGLEVDPELADRRWRAGLLEGAARRSGRRRERNAAGATRRRTSSTTYRRANSLARKTPCTRSGWLRTRSEAHRAFDLFVEIYEAKYSKATSVPGQGSGTSCLAFYDFPAEHWKHLRTTNPIESTFATVRLRTKRTKGSGSRIACLTMVFKLAQAAERKWRKLDGHSLLGDVIRGVQFKDGIKVAA